MVCDSYLQNILLFLPVDNTPVHSNALGITSEDFTIHSNNVLSE